MLYEQLNEQIGIRNIFRTVLSPAIVQNLSPKMTLRDYQLRALRYYTTFMEEFHPNQKNSHLLFHMATGSGKTVIMASAILDLYERGHRNFLFFVNSSNIIRKTKENFLNSKSSKFLFSPEVVISGQRVVIREIKNLSNLHPNSINIMFSTIQDLHMQLTNPRENGLSLEDLRDTNLVLISDEAHHLNASTKRSSRKNANRSHEDHQQSWEETVQTLHNSNPRNILLEFTATMDFSNLEVEQKYREKLIFDYPLKEFRRDKYSKDVTVEIFDSHDLFQRAMVAVLSSQYRKRLLLKYKIGRKPVVLFKSKTIEESRSFQRIFTKQISQITEDSLRDFLDRDKKILQDLSILLKDSRTNLEDFLLELREDFGPDKQLVVNSLDESEEAQIKVNTLEDPDNQFRCIFAVDKLNEGWDVLNLFDIVRLYDTRDPTGETGMRARKVGRTTMSEAQLIGRGARYFPFQLSKDQDRFRRKFDDDLVHELRICETLSYHCAHNPKYVQELNSALQEIGIKPKEAIVRKLELKDSFRKSSFFEEGLIYLNKRVHREKSNLPKFSDYLRKNFNYRLDSGRGSSIDLFIESTEVGRIRTHVLDVEVSKIAFEIMYVALSKVPSLSFLHLQKLFPDLTSVREFISSPNYLGSVKIQVETTNESFADFTSEQTMSLASSLAFDIALILDSGKTDFFGSTEFYPHPIREVFYDKELNFHVDLGFEEQLGKSMKDNLNPLYLDLDNTEWYAFTDCFGTSEEKSFVRFISKKLKEDFFEGQSLFVLRNERFFKLFDFKTGSALEPDYVLFIGTNSGSSVTYQVFVEPKGQHLVQMDSWKEEFLTSLAGRAEVQLLLDTSSVRLWGLPFYQSQSESNFEVALEAMLEESTK